MLELAEAVVNTRTLRIGLLVLAIGVVSLLHYITPTSHVWLHPLLQRAYYIPLLLMALWFGWRGGLAAALVAALLYIPHIEMAWQSHPEYSAAQYIEIVMFFVITALTGVLADHERTQRRKAEDNARRLAEVNAELQSSFEQLQRADRLSALGELSAGLAHEIRNPLGSVEGAVQILRRPSLRQETREEFGELAQKELNRLKGLLTHFLDFARPQAPQRAPTEPRLLLESVARLASETAKMGGVQVRVEAADDLPAVLFDPEQIGQVLLNLVINAVQAMPQGGRIVLRGRCEADSILLEVVDEGIGIAPENLERIFNPFFTTRQGGTGLGLAIAYRIIHQHNGDIAARPIPDRGMTFTIQLPLVQPATAEPQVTQSRQ